MLATVAFAQGGFQYVSPGCSWYEHHMMGGCRRPSLRSECQTEDHPHGPHHLGVIIPFRGRVESSSFNDLCSHLPQHLRRSGISFDLLLVNQVDDLPFNRAALANAGFSIFMGRTGARWVRRPPDYLTIHDVDRFPVPPGHSVCDPITARYYDYPAAAPRVLHPSSYTGGVLLITGAQFQRVNGFSNKFWGWGHEDNELYGRLRWCGLRPEHGLELDQCMVHRDCPLCQAAKEKQATRAALQHETRSIALLQQNLMQPWQRMQSDGISSLNFTTLGRSRRLACGDKTLHVADVALVREVTPPQACTANGGAADDGCSAPVPKGEIPSGLVDQTTRTLPKGSKLLEVVSASRARVVYNFNWEVDLLVEDKRGRRAVHRLAFCAQVWQPKSVPDKARYHPLWRAMKREGGAKFKRTANFTYGGHFPCDRVA